MEAEERNRITEELNKTLDERNAIVACKAWINIEEEKRYNNLGKVILELRRKLY